MSFDKPLHLNTAPANDAKRNLSETAQQVQKRVTDLGFEYFSFLLQPSMEERPAFRSEPLFLSTYPKAWWQRYLDQKYYRLDPVIDETRRSASPSIWGGRKYLKSLSDENRKVMGEAREHGIVSAVSVPLNHMDGTYTLFTIASEEPRRETENLIRERIVSIVSVGISANEALRQRAHMGRDGVKLALTRRERDCLSLVAMGLTHAEIAEIIGRSEATVRFHTQSARRKLSARNSVHAAYLAKLSAAGNFEAAL